MKTMRAFLLLLGTVAICHAAVSVSPADLAPLRFAAAEIERAAKVVQQPAPEATISVKAGAAQSYRIQREGAKVGQIALGFRAIGIRTKSAVFIASSR